MSQSGDFGGLPPYRNFYVEFEKFGRYTGYGVAIYHRDSRRDDRLSDEVFLRDALRLCREEFGKAYRNHLMSRYTTSGNHMFDPQFVAVVVDDMGGQPQAGIVVLADELFSDVPLDDVMKSAHISRGKLWFDDITAEEARSGYSPGKKVRFTHIEEHEKSRKGKAG